MKKVKIIIEKASDGTFSAYGKNVKGVYGMGDTAGEAKESALEGLQLFIKHNDEKNIPAILKGKYEVVFQFDTQSLFAYYKGIFTNAGFEKLTGINQRQIQHYSTGHRTPRIQQSKKIEKALHQLGAELLAVEL